MNSRSRVWAALAAAALVSSAGAFAQSTSTEPANPTTPKMTQDNARAESEYRSAQTACQAQSPSTRDQCMRDAKARYDKATKGSKNAGGNDSSSTSGSSSGLSGTGTSNGAPAGTGGMGTSGGTSGAGTSSGSTGGGTSGSTSGGGTSGSSGGAGGNK